MESVNQKKRRIFGKKDFKDYLEELNKLAKFPVTINHIISIVETDKILESFNGKRIYKERMEFKDKIKLQTIFSNISRIVLDDFLLFTSYSKNCGAMHLKSINNFNHAFKFNDEHSGLISLINECLDVKIVMDFYEEQNEEYLELEIYTIDNKIISTPILDSIIV
ncbi:hypothetical protein FA048_00005 [Pedobacter polaris]|uniref:Uncharacterized protein n=1 Tax=Pedobacter polaris TaxID=2571273 RepID=A0A4U1CSC7_9SPHI|nr:hypothetical protein [Pedobacter polaris]TKC12037.1 hypothetical protein FA048_00005 [Pedobacter polaris]